jgi:hypothetical protein
MAMGRDAHRQTAAPDADHDGSGRPAPPPAAGETPRRRRSGVAAGARRLIRAIRDSDEASVEEAVLRLSRSRRLFAPFALAASAVVMLFVGLKLLFSNWRLTLIQVLPAMWIWLAMYDLKAHVFYGKTYHVVSGPARIPIVLAAAAITAASFFLNAVFAFAIAKPGPPLIRPAFREARSHLAVILGSGAVVGICLGLSTGVLIRWGLWWFALSLSIVIAVMMVCYVAIPSRLIGMKATQSKRDKLAATAVGGVIGAVVCTPPYALGRVGLLMLGSRALLIPGLVVFLTGLTLQAGTTGAVKAIKMGAKFVSGYRPAAGKPPPASPVSSAPFPAAAPSPSAASPLPAQPAPAAPSAPAAPPAAGG